MQPVEKATRRQSRVGGNRRALQLSSTDMVNRRFPTRDRLFVLAVLPARCCRHNLNVLGAQGQAPELGAKAAVGGALGRAVQRVRPAVCPGQRLDVAMLSRGQRSSSCCFSRRASAELTRPLRHVELLRVQVTERRVTLHLSRERSFHEGVQ